MSNKKTIQPGKKYSYKEVTEIVEETTKDYRKSIHNQMASIGRFVLYLQQKGLLDDYNMWMDGNKNGEAEDKASDSEDQRA